MLDLRSSQAFRFICQLYNWDNDYIEFMQDSYSQYPCVDEAVSAICSDYDLDYSRIIDRSHNVSNDHPTKRFMDEQMITAILSTILRSQSPEIRKYTKSYPDMSCYSLQFVKDNVYTLVYTDYVHGGHIVIGDVSVSLDCMQYVRKPNSMRKCKGVFQGHVYDKQYNVAIKFILKM